MALRRPVYLDIETLIALGEYHGLDMPRLTNVVEKTVKKRSGNAKVSFGGIGGGAELGKDVELQSSFTIDPSEKASVSKVIDGLLKGEHTVPVSEDAVLKKDDIVEVEGLVHLTAASLAGKMFYILRKYLESTDQDIKDLNFSNIGPDVMKLIQSVYLRNELVPIPILIDVVKTGLAPRVLVNLQPNLFVDSATRDQIEGDRRVLGTVRNLVAEGDDGYVSTEDWLLPDWEYLIKRLLMTEISNKVQEIVASLKIDLPAKDIHAWIEGPAVVLEAVAIY